MNQPCFKCVVYESDKSLMRIYNMVLSKTNDKNNETGWNYVLNVSYFVKFSSRCL